MDADPQMVDRVGKACLLILEHDCGGYAVLGKMLKYLNCFKLNLKSKLKTAIF